MNTKLKSIFKTITLSLGALLLVTTATYATANLIPSGTPGSDTQYSLNDIYTRLTTNEAATEGSGLFTTPEGEPTPSFRTLTEIYEAIPTIDPTKVALGTTYLGVEGTLSTEPAELEWSSDQGLGFTWYQAVDHCDVLPEDGGGWRLPTYIELTNAYLTGVPGFFGEYFSNSIVPHDSTAIYFVRMVLDGTSGGTLKDSNWYRVRCVR